LGKFTITHPYHPLNGKSYDILKLTTISGVRHYLFLLADEIYCVPESWTDRCAIETSQPRADVPFDARHLAELADLLKAIKVFAKNAIKSVDGLNV
jgi:hypothetical protein